MDSVDRKCSLSATCQVHSSLVSCLAPSLALLRPFLAQITSERQQKVSVLRLHVRLAFNKMKSSRTVPTERAPSLFVTWYEEFGLSLFILCSQSHFVKNTNLQQANREFYKLFGRIQSKRGNLVSSVKKTGPNFSFTNSFG